MKLHSLLVMLLVSTFTACEKKPEIFVDIRGLENTSDTLRHFIIHNKGNEDLKILNHTASCECTALNLKNNDIISPKDSLIVDVKINQQQLDTDQLIYITLKTNANPQLTSFYFKQ